MSAAMNKMLAVFQSKGYSPRSGISQSTFYAIVDQLLGSQFDRQVADELWQQADLNPNYEAEVQQLCEILEDAQNILIDKNRQVSQRIQRLVQRQRELDTAFNIDPQQKALELQEIAREISELERDRIEFTEDLYFVTAPFGINAMPPGTVALNLALRTSNQPVPGDIAAAAMGKSLAQRGADMAAANLGRSLMNQANQGNFGNMGMSGSMPFGGMSRRSGLGAPPPMGMGFDGEGIVPPPKPGTNNDLMYVFWITIIIGLFEIVMMFKKYNFLNLLVVCCILSIFLLNYFDKNYVKACLALTALSILLDLIWLFIFGSTFWSPPSVGEFASSERDYLRLIVLFTILSLLLKIPLMILLFRHKDITADSNYVFDMGRMHIFANKRNLVSQSIAEVVRRENPPPVY